MGSDREQDLARTATAAASAKVGAAESVGAMLGRYRLERELGAGAMGVVHAAFDPDLERRVALKVLRGATASREAKDRLMREARAMARLAHPNVITVHEVGTAGGRDFVAMELVHGETLAAWLRSSKRPTAAIIAAFLAAGRGLAAAHAAGIVHRDFKPHNVLRGSDGRIVVTDFGLARQAEGGLPVALDTTLPVGTPATETSIPSSLERFTVTGALLGTPAYMAPEQWSGCTVTPATDQFAFCVALWEALAGERPYRGPSLEELRMQVARGPAQLDRSHIPHRLRGLLRRGLDPDPARRWPSMDAVLVQLVRAKRRPGRVMAIAGGGIVAAAVLFAATRVGDVPAAVCEPPARDVMTVWSPAIAAEVRAKTSDAHVAVLAAAYEDWQTARARACTAPSKVRQAQLSCLDGVLGRFDALRQAFDRVPTATAEEIQGQLIDPEICRKPSVSEIPRLTLGPTPGVLAAYELYARSETDHKPSDAEFMALIDKRSTSSCARMIATLAFGAASRDFPRARTLMDDATRVVEQCGDDRLRADLLIQSVRYQREIPVIGPKGDAAIERAEAAAKRVLQPDVEAAIASQRIPVAEQRERWDEAFRLADTALVGYRSRGMYVRQTRTVIRRNRLRMLRAESGDLETVISDVQNWRPIAMANHRVDLAAELDRQAAVARFWLGDVTAGHAELLRLWRSRPHARRSGETREIHGQVVDAQGRAAAGANVAMASFLGADSIGIGLPQLDFDDNLQITTTDDTGHFVITEAVQTGVIAAQLADRRSRPAAITDHVRLVLAPTRRVSGKVDLGTTPHTRLVVTCLGVGELADRYPLVAPVSADGSFVVEGATIGALRVSVSINDYVEFYSKTQLQFEFQTRPASRAPISDLRLSVTSSVRVVDIVVRSTVAIPLEAAQVFLLPGKPQIRTAGDLFRFRGSSIQTELAKPPGGEDGLENGLRPALDKVRAGDLVAHVEHVVPGELTVCAIAFNGDLFDPQVWQRMRDHTSELTFQCGQIGPDTAVVALSVPPQRRFD